jgi:hypothetical protein
MGRKRVDARCGEQARPKNSMWPQAFVEGQTMATPISID